MAGWVIWYADGSSFSDDDGEARDAPRSGVQCIAVADRSCGRHVLSEQNYYCWQDGAWVPHDRDGLEQYLDDPAQPGIRLRGYWIDRSRYVEIRRIALKEDTRLPPVTAGPPRDPEGS